MDTLIRTIPIGAAPPAVPQPSGRSLSTRYLGLELSSPLVASASPLNARIENLRLLEDAGAAAIVLPSLFQEQVEAEAASQEDRIGGTGESSPEALSYFPAAAIGPYGLARLVRQQEITAEIIELAPGDTAIRSRHAWA